jgi:hypothetical protein
MVGPGRIEGEEKDVEVRGFEGGDPAADLGRRFMSSRDGPFTLEEVEERRDRGHPRQDARQHGASSSPGHFLEPEFSRTLIITESRTEKKLSMKFAGGGLEFDQQA